MLTRETEPNSEARQIPGKATAGIEGTPEVRTRLPGHPPGTFCRLVFECCILFTGVSICVCVDSFFRLFLAPNAAALFFSANNRNNLHWLREKREGRITTS